MRSFASSVAATLPGPAARQGFMPTAAIDLSCTLGPRPCLCAEVSIARTSSILRSGATPCMPGLAAAARARFGKPLVKEALMKFEDLGLAEPLLRAVRAQGYPATTKIQAAAIPPVLEGRDVLGCARPEPARRPRSPCPPCSDSAGPSAASTGADGRSARWCSRPRANWPCKSARVSRSMAAIRPCGRPRSTAASASRRKSGP